MKKTNTGVVATIDRFENGLAVLELDHNQNLTVAKRNLPKGVKEGDVLQVEFLTDELATKRKENLAKAMLEEILKGD
jgi:hypothetical protein